MKKLQKNTFIFLLIYLGVLISLNSTWVREVMHPSDLVTKIYTVLLYVPFVFAVFYKLLTDFRHFKDAITSVSNWIFYGFALYYVALSAFRFISGMEVKENLYYTIIFLGAIAMYMLLRDERIYMPRKDVEKNILGIALFFLLFRLAYCLIGSLFLARSPININLTSGAVAILLPFVGNMLINPSTDKKKAILPWLVFCSGIVVIATTGARALFTLTAGIVGVMLVVAIIRRRGVLRIVTAIILGCAIVLALAVADVGDVRYAIYRQSGITINLPQYQKETTPVTIPTENPSEAPTEEPTEAPTQEPTTPVDPEHALDQEQVKAQNQIAASDWMRKRLVQMGLDEVKKNPLFGTGDVMYWYQVSEAYGFMQSSHNFLIETIICYGGIGLLMIAALFISMLIEAKLFTKRALCRWNYTVALLLTVLFYFAFGFVQPTVYDFFICPLFVLVIAAYRKVLQEVE